MVIPGISYEVLMKGRQIRTSRTSAANIKQFHPRQVEVHNNIAQIAWGGDLGLDEPPPATAPLYTLTDREAAHNLGGT